MENVSVGGARRLVIAELAYHRIRARWLSAGGIRVSHVWHALVQDGCHIFAEPAQTPSAMAARPLRIATTSA